MSSKPVDPAPLERVAVIEEELVMAGGACTVSWLVRYHLLMTATAFKRVLAGPQKIEDFVHTGQSPERLQLLVAGPEPGLAARQRAVLVEDQEPHPRRPDERALRNEHQGGPSRPRQKVRLTSARA